MVRVSAMSDWLTTWRGPSCLPRRHSCRRSSTALNERRDESRRCRLKPAPRLSRLPSGLRLQFGLHGFRYFTRRPFALCVLAPFPLRQVVVGILQPALHGELIDADQELWVQRQTDLLFIVLSLDLRGDFLPVKNSIRGHSLLLVLGINPQPPKHSRRSRPHRSRRQTSG